MSKNTSEKPATKDGVTVVVCAKNEAHNLENVIPQILNQKYPLFEIILVNDHSTDTSLAVMQKFANLNSNLKILDLTHQSGKKAGITEAIATASYEKILLTDADCLPKSSSWISLMSENLFGDKEFVFGYSGYKKQEKSWLNKIIRFETLFTALQYFGYAENHNPYMGVGRNLCYLKTTFENANGFEKHIHIKAGDDDLFVNQNATATNVSLSYNPDSFTYSEPKKTWKEWFVQKRRHTDVAKEYKPKHQLQLSLFYVSQFAVFALAIAALISRQFLISVCVLIICRTLFVWIVTSKAALKLNEKELIPFLPILEAFLISLQMLIFISNILVKPRSWN